MVAIIFVPPVFVVHHWGAEKKAEGQSFQLALIPEGVSLVWNSFSGNTDRPFDRVTPGQLFFCEEEREEHLPVKPHGYVFHIHLKCLEDRYLRHGRG